MFSSYTNMIIYQVMTTYNAYINDYKNNRLLVLQIHHMEDACLLLKLYMYYIVCQITISRRNNFAIRCLPVVGSPSSQTRPNQPLSPPSQGKPLPLQKFTKGSAPTTVPPASDSSIASLVTVTHRHPPLHLVDSTLNSAPCTCYSVSWLVWSRPFQ